MTNRIRANWGCRAVESGSADYGKHGDDACAFETEVSDALANIMHYCVELSVFLDFERCLDRARRDFEAEHAEEIFAVARANNARR